MKFAAVISVDGIARLACLDFSDSCKQVLEECPELFETYSPGELLSQCAAANCMALPPEQDSHSQCSTVDALSANGAGPDSLESSLGCLTPELPTSAARLWDSLESSSGYLTPEPHTTSCEPEVDLDRELVSSADPLPSIGSAGHAKGLCNPCGFVHKRGCEAGAECTFCHLCPPGCIEQIRKERRKIARAARRERCYEQATTTQSVAVDDRFE